MRPLGLIVLALAAVLSMSLVPVLIKSSAANEILIAISRLGIAVLFIMPIMLWRRPVWGLGARDWGRLALIGLVFAIHWLTYFVSIKWATAGLAATAISTFSLQYLLLAWWFNGERLTPFECLALVICFAGCLVIAPSLSLGSEVTLGVLIGCGSALLYAMLPLLHQRARHIGTLQRTWGQFFFALLFLLPFLPMANWQELPTEWERLAVLGLLCTVIAHGLWVKVTTELPAIYTGLIYYLYVPIAMGTSFVFLDEAIGSRQIIGALMILAAGCTVTGLRWRRPVADVDDLDVRAPPLPQKS